MIKGKYQYMITEDGLHAYKINLNTDEVKELKMGFNGSKYPYLRVSWGGKERYVHDLVWEYHGKGIKTKGLTIDHIDGNHLNNDISNLRLLTLQENSRIGYERTCAKFGVNNITELRWGK